MSNRSYEHRRQQIQDDMLRLASLFYIDIAAFAVMSNHYHLVLHVRRDDALIAPPESIVRRALELVRGDEVIQKYHNKEVLERWEHDQVDAFVDKWRKRLFDISWFMKYLNEGIARRASKEDGCKGHFWESRYKLHALLDEKAVLSAMAYVDLNPISAALAATPGASDYTSIQQRIACWKEKAAESRDACNKDEAFQPEDLMKFTGNHTNRNEEGLNYRVLDYLELVDWTGRAIRYDKRGAIQTNTPPILKRLEINPEQWVEIGTNFETRFKGLVGSLEVLKVVCGTFGLKRAPEIQVAKRLFC